MRCGESVSADLKHTLSPQSRNNIVYVSVNVIQVSLWATHKKQSPQTNISESPMLFQPSSRQCHWSWLQHNTKLYLQYNEREITLDVWKSLFLNHIQFLKAIETCAFQTLLGLFQQSWTFSLTSVVFTHSVLNEPRTIIWMGFHFYLFFRNLESKRKRHFIYMRVCMCTNLSEWRYKVKNLSNVANTFKICNLLQHSEIKL